MTEAERSLLAVTSLPGWGGFSRGMKSALEFIPTSKTLEEASGRAQLRPAFISEESYKNKAFKFAVKIRKESRGKNSRPFADEEIRVTRAFEFLDSVIAGEKEADAQQLKAVDLVLKHSLGKVAVNLDERGPDSLNLSYGKNGR